MNEANILNEEFQYIVEVDDPDNTEFIYDLSGEPDGMVLNNGTITWTPTITDEYGPITLTVTDLDNENPQSSIQIFSLYVRLLQNFALSEGNNLISYLGVFEDNSIENMLLDLSDNITQISTENYAAILQEDGTWIGSLDYIEPTKGYWMRLNQNSDYGIATYQTDISQTYNLHMGWKWELLPRL